MTQDGNKALVLRYFNGEESLVDQNCRIFLSGDMPCSGWMTKDERETLTPSILETVGPFTTSLGDMVAEGDRVWVEWESNATLVNGNNYNNHYVYMFKFQDEKIVEQKFFVDSLHMYRVLDSPEVRGEPGERQSPLTNITQRIVTNKSDEADPET